MDSEQRLVDLAARHHGVFSVEDARSIGVPSKTLRTRLASGRYQRLYPGVYAIAGSVDSSSRRMVAAVKSFPQSAAISHQTAAQLWGLTQKRVPGIDVVTTRWEREHRSDLRVHESLDLLGDDIVEFSGIPVTAPARTVVDLGASNKWVVESALEQGIRRGLFTLDEVEGFVRRVGRRGRRGVGVIRPLLKARRRWDTVTESVLEDEFRKLVVDWGLPPPELQYEVRDEGGLLVCRADFAYPDSRLLIELDSEAHHLDRLTFRRDRSKQNRVVVLGWTVLRYTWWDVTEAPGRVASEISAKVDNPSVSA
ncbi:MAG: type IV toxin-antitoxin system AbiEi family antitoxin domain-containing protein [Acidimicrobiia bacterium]|nr:type IV toxin-antitoxin system AbiEi family antitoxin domain-containing protein [Acidimicrobiia bacterium]